MTKAEIIRLLTSELEFAHAYRLAKSGHRATDAQDLVERVFARLNCTETQFEMIQSSDEPLPARPPWN